MKFYSIKDVVAEEFGPIFGAKNDGVALRNFDSLVANVAESAKDDFVLYSIGDFDVTNGDFKANLSVVEKEVAE